MFDVFRKSEATRSGTNCAMTVLSGLDSLRRNDYSSLRGKRVGLVCNQASISRDIRHTLDLFLEAGLDIAAVFGPQHGLFGHTQDNMIEWEGTRDPRTGLRVYSLYGENRQPTPAMLEHVEELIVDLPDVGARYYTFIWTMALCMMACEPLGIPVTVLDRPNPIGGEKVEGTVLQMGFDSFVGHYPLPMRHGKTIGEIAKYLQTNYFPNLRLRVEEMEGWDRGLYGDQTGLPWAMPSPNMPTVDTAVVYPGGCLLEATNLSEGRGTTRPFEIFGAPYLDSWQFSDALNRLNLPGCTFRPLPFEPTFNKHAGRLCGGCQLHVTSRDDFEPVLAYVAIMQEAIRQSGLHDASHLPQAKDFIADSSEMRLPGFAWRNPPYEYVHDRSPIDILAGNDWLSEAISNLAPLKEIGERMQEECGNFGDMVRA